MSGCVILFFTAVSRGNARPRLTDSVESQLRREHPRRGPQLRHGVLQVRCAPLLPGPKRPTSARRTRPSLPPASASIVSHACARGRAPAAGYGLRGKVDTPLECRVGSKRRRASRRSAFRSCWPDQSASRTSVMRSTTASWQSARRWCVLAAYWPRIGRVLAAHSGRRTVLDRMGNTVGYSQPWGVVSPSTH